MLRGHDMPLVIAGSKLYATDKKLTLYILVIELKAFNTYRRSVYSQYIALV